MKRENMMFTVAWPKYCVQCRGEEHTLPYFAYHPRSKDTPFLSSCLNAFMGKLKIRWESQFHTEFDSFVPING